MRPEALTVNRITDALRSVLAERKLYIVNAGAAVAQGVDLDRLLAEVIVRCAEILRKEDIEPALPKLEDIFAGPIAMTASQRGYVSRAVTDHYMNGGWCPKGVNRRDFARQVLAKFNALKLDRMVTPDGARLVSVDEHIAIVAELNRLESTLK